MMAFPNYTYPAYGGYNPVTPFAPAPQVYQPQQPPQQPSQAVQPQGNVNTQPTFFCRPVLPGRKRWEFRLTSWEIPCFSRTWPIM